MAKFLDEPQECENEVFLVTPTIREKIYGYKQTIMEVMTMLKMLHQNFKDYIAPETAVLDRLGHKPKGRSVLISKRSPLESGTLACCSQT